MSHESLSEHENTSPGSYFDFVNDLKEKGIELDPQAAFELYNEALATYNTLLAQKRGVAPEELHYGEVEYSS